MDIYTRALKLLAKRDHTEAELRQKLEASHGEAPQDLINQLTRQNYLNDGRFAENYVLKRKERGAIRIREELLVRGVAPRLADEILLSTVWPSLKQSLKVRMDDWNLRPPLHRRDAARLFRALARLGYDEDDIREEVEQLHDQQ